MAEIGSTAALILAVVLLWASVAKLRAPAATARTFSALGLRRPNALARVVPAAEVLVAVLLCARPALGGWAAFGLLAAFTTVLAPGVVRGRAVSCGCFGSSSQAPVTWSTLVRNAALAVAALSATAATSLTIGWGGIITSVTAALIVALTVALLDARRAAGGALFVIRALRP